MYSRLAELHGVSGTTLGSLYTYQVKPVRKKLWAAVRHGDLYGAAAQSCLWSVCQTCICNLTS